MYKLANLLVSAFFSLLVTSSLMAQLPVVDTWKYTLRKPAENWQEAEFDDGAWKEGPGGFGTRETPGARVGTNWSTNNIWLRKTMTMDAVPAKVALLIHHDEGAEIYINGTQVAALQGHCTEYQIVPIAGRQRTALRPGKNVLAVHCAQSRGGQFIDVHVVDADNVSKLPPAKRDTRPFQSELITRWGEQVQPDNAWTEYPRPQLVRDQWQNLNGQWDYAITPVEQTKVPASWGGKILVPYCLESKLGGVQRLLDATEALWYRRTFKVSTANAERTLLNFEAVDYRCEVLVNGKPVGKHQGGNTPFSFDITDAVTSGENELVVRVEDETEGWQLRGKQVLNARGIWYTQVSGIWQSVWLEQVPSTYIQDLEIATDAKNGTIVVRPRIEGSAIGAKIEIAVADAEKQIATAEGSATEPHKLVIDGAKLWSPDSPHLYDLVVRLLDGDGKPVDRVVSYAGIRTVGKVRDEDGHWRFTLNGETIFHWGPLDQGWWPDGLLTPPSDEAMLFDIEYLKSAGFNMIRKHIKVEPRRYYYHCDRLGMMVWQDQVSGGKSPPWTRLKPSPVDAEWPQEQHNQFMLELERMIDTLKNHPSITVWVPFNESWGQHRTTEVGEWMVKRDPTRLVNIASGGNFWPVGDVVDAHKYPHPGFPFDQGEGRFNGFIKVMGEFGGHGYPVKGHLWDSQRRNWGYGGLPQNEEEYKERYQTSLRMLNELRAQGIAAGVYTQTTDVEGEINGLMTYDRKVVKIPAKELAALHTVLFTDTSKSQQEPSTVETGQPRPVMEPQVIRAGLQSHDHALYIKAGWIRDPYIVLAPDGTYYLTGTTPNPSDQREAADPYNIGLGAESIVGYHMQLWRSKDLVSWEYLGTPFSLLDGYWAKKLPEAFEGADRTHWHLWAPEVHFLNGRWHVVHTTPGPVRRGSNLAVTEGKEIQGPFAFPLGDLSRGRHDPSLFQDEDRTVYLLWQNTLVAP